MHFIGRPGPGRASVRPAIELTPEQRELRDRVHELRHEHLTPVRLLPAPGGRLRCSLVGAPELPAESVLRASGRAGRWAGGEVVTLLVPVARALAAVHEAGLALGGVALDCIRLDSDGRPSLASTQAPVVGSPRLRDEDVRSLAVLAWRLVSGIDPGDELLVDVVPAVPLPLAALLTAVLDAPEGSLPTAAAFADHLFGTCEAVPLRVPATREPSVRPSREAAGDSPGESTGWAVGAGADVSGLRFGGPLHAGEGVRPVPTSGRRPAGGTSTISFRASR